MFQRQGKADVFDVLGIEAGEHGDRQQLQAGIDSSGGVASGDGRTNGWAVAVDREHADSQSRRGARGARDGFRHVIEFQSRKTFLPRPMSHSMIFVPPRICKLEADLVKGDDIAELFDHALGLLDGIDVERDDQAVRSVRRGSHGSFWGLHRCCHSNVILAGSRARVKPQ